LVGEPIAILSLATADGLTSSTEQPVHVIGKLPLIHDRAADSKNWICSDHGVNRSCSVPPRDAGW